MLERIIMNNYTALNPAVEWRFNEVAARQVAAYMRDDEELPIESVRFENVYPIYGAIDVKGSTQLRNSIYKKDYLSKINHLQIGRASCRERVQFTMFAGSISTS